MGHIGGAVLLMSHPHFAEKSCRRDNIIPPLHVA